MAALDDLSTGGSSLTAEAAADASTRGWLRVVAGLGVLVALALPLALRSYARSNYPGKEGLWLTLLTTHSLCWLPLRHRPADVRDAWRRELRELRALHELRASRTKHRHHHHHHQPAPMAGRLGARRQQQVVSASHVATHAHCVDAVGDVVVDAVVIKEDDFLQL